MNTEDIICMAAKAAGIDYYHQDSFGNIHEKKGGTWNPLTDDGDALRLAVKLNLNVEIQGQAGIHPRTEIPSRTSKETMHGIHVGIRETHHDDPYAATRRAIVRAAAEIGKDMK